MPGPGSLTSYNIAPGQSQGDIDLKKKMALQLMMEGSSAAPVQHWTQALARAVQGGMGGYELYKQDQEDQADREKARGIVSALSGGPVSTPVPMPGSAPIDPTQPRGIRNNNPLNIESGKFTQGQPGYTGSDGRFAQFSAPDQGQAAADKLLQVYAGKGINTVAGIVNRWAPPSDNNPTPTYAATVAKQIGVDPNAPINIADPSVRQKIIGAMAQFENGKPVQMAPVGAPVDQPRGGLGDERRQQLISTLMQTRAGAAMGQQLFAKELDREANRTRPLTEGEKTTYPGAVAIEASGKPIFPPPSTSVQLSTVANPVLEGVGKQIVDQRTNAQTAALQTIPSVHDARRALDMGATTGAFAEGRVDLAKVGSLFGINDPSKIENTEVLRAAVGNGVLAHIKSLGANPSNADRDYIEKVQGGQIKLEEGSIRRILDIQEKYARQTIRNFNDSSKKLIDASPEGTYKQIAPLMKFDEPGPYVAPPNVTGSAPANSGEPAKATPVKVTSPDEARKLPKGTPIILPDGSPGIVP